MHKNLSEKLCKLPIDKNSERNDQARSAQIKKSLSALTGFHSASSLNSHTHGFWSTFVYRTTERPCGRKSLSVWSYSVNLRPNLFGIALPLPYTIIIPYSVDFVNTFLIFFRVALVRSHFKPVCVLRTICIAGGRSLCVGSVPHFQFTVLL